MKAPVWALIAHIDLTGSSSGDHRYKLMDNCIRHFSDWWLIGYQYYNNWGWDMWDLCNQFVVIALTGGLLTLIFYIAIFKRSFAAIGTARKRVRGTASRNGFSGAWDQPCLPMSWRILGLTIWLQLIDVLVPSCWLAFLWQPLRQSGQPLLEASKLPRCSTLPISFRRQCTD